MGPRETPPPLPHLEATMQPVTPRINRILRYCNWLQALEGDIDTLHSEYLHSPARIDVTKMTPGTGPYYRHRLRDKLKFDARDTDFGTSYGAYRPAEENTTYWRIAHFLFPCYTMTPSPAAGSSTTARMWVPVDDDHVLKWQIEVNVRTAGRAENETANSGQTRGSEDGGYGTEYLPDTTDWLGRNRPLYRKENDYRLNREDQRTVSFTGIPGGANPQDTAVTESMGALLDRSQEHLGVSDTMIIRTRQRLLGAMRALEDGGVIPPGVDNPEVYGTRSGWMILPNGVDWWEGSRELRKTFVALHEETDALAALKA
jgi:hypothetical protein